MKNEQVKTIAKWLGAGSINIFGCPFSGKDTQARKLADTLNGVLVAGGDILRSYHDQALVKQLMSTGDLFPTDLYLQIVLPYLSKPELREKPLILSSIGRLHGEESVIMKATSDSGHPIKAVISLELPEPAVWQRFEEARVDNDRGDRMDDKRDVLVTRLKKFREETMPVIEFYRDKGLLIEIDGTPSREAITDNILNSLLSLTSR